LVSRIPTPWAWFFLIGPGLAALQAGLYFPITRLSRPAGRLVDVLAGYRASFYHKLMLGFTLLGVLIFAVGWLGFAALEEMHANVHQSRLIAHWSEHLAHVQIEQGIQLAALH